MDEAFVSATKSVGSVPAAGRLDMVVATCPRHGPARVFRTTDQLGHTYTGRCPRCQEEEREREVVEIQRRRADPVQILLSSMIAAQMPEDYLEESFETFRFDGLGDPKRDLVQACREFLDSQDRTLVMLGPCGVGKTHLSCSIMREGLRLGRSARYTTEGALLRSIRATYSRKDGPTEEDVIQRFVSCDILAIDEMGSAPWSTYSVQALADIIDTRVGRRRKTVFTGNMSLEVFKAHLSDASVSRITMGRVFEVSGDDHRRRKKAREGR